MTVTVFDQQEYDGEWPTPPDGTYTSLADVIRWFQAKLEAVPEQYRADVKCEIDGQHDYEEARAHIEIWYDRPETDEEYENRTTQDARHKERVRELQARAANTRDRRGDAKLVVKGLTTGLQEMRKRGLTE